MELTTLITILGSLVATVGSLTWWLATQFKSTRDLIFTQVQKVLDKLEYHEKRDDRRFQEVRDDIWEIRLRNAAIDGKILNKHRKDEETRKQDE